jgi:hypothetical protein
MVFCYALAVHLRALYGPAQCRRLRKGAVLNQHAVRGLFLACLLASVVFAQAASPRKSIDPQSADLITRVKDVSASRLERGLPSVRFEDWVRVNAGPEWTITWSFNQRPKSAANQMLDFPDSVDVRGDTKDGRYFRLSIGTTTNANQVLLFWLSGAANLQHGWVGLEHLSQLPRLLHHSSQNSHTSVGQK